MERGDYIAQLEHEIRWLRREIAKLEEKARRRPSACRQIAQYRYQIRHSELTIAFKYGDQAKTIN
jgi:hypothetical protein